MADNLRDVTIIARGGLYTNEDPLTLAGTEPGSAIRMTNFEISQFGGYRRINGYEYYDADNPQVPGAGKVLGVWIHNDKVYAARRNSVDSTSATLPVGAISLSSGSSIVTVTSTAHGLSVGEWITFSNIDTGLGGLDLNNSEFNVASAATADSFTFVADSAADSTVSSTAANITYTVSRYYTIYSHADGVGWSAVNNTSDTNTRSAVGVTKLRTNEHSFTGSEVVIVVDGVNRPLRHSSTTPIELYDRQGSGLTETEDQLSNPFSISSGTSIVTVDHVAHGMHVGDIVKFSNVNVNIGTEDINDNDYTVATVVDADSYTFTILATATSTQNNVGGTAVNWFYTHTDIANIEGSKFVTDFRNHLFFAGSEDNPNRITFSNPNSDLRYDPAGGAGEVNVGFIVTGIAKFRDALYVFGKRQIKRLQGNNSSDFVLSEVTGNIGCVASDSIIEIGGDILFLASDGIRPIQGTARIGDIELQTVSKPIQQILQGLPENYDLDLMSSVVIKNKSQFRYFFPNETGSASDAFGIIGGLRFANNSVGWEFGELLGIRSFVAYSDIINSIETTVHGDLDGYVFKQESGNSFNGSDVLAVYATPFFYFDSTERRKVFHKLSIYTRPEGTSEFNLAVYYDWDDPNKYNPNSYSMSTQGAILRYFSTGGTYGSTFTFGGSSSPVLEKNIQGSGRSVSFRYYVNRSQKHLIVFKAGALLSKKQDIDNGRLYTSVFSSDS
jgi:hypothetical protein